MELITQYSYDGKPGSAKDVSVYLDGDIIRKRYSDGAPDDVMLAETYRDRLLKRPYNKLFSGNQVILDFLNARLGG